MKQNKIKFVSSTNEEVTEATGFHYEVTTTSEIIDTVQYILNKGAKINYIINDEVINDVNSRKKDANIDNIEASVLDVFQMYAPNKPNRSIKFTISTDIKFENIIEKSNIEFKDKMKEAQLVYVIPVHINTVTLPSTFSSETRNILNLSITEAVIHAEKLHFNDEGVYKHLTLNVIMNPDVKDLPLKIEVPSSGLLKYLLYNVENIETVSFLYDPRVEENRKEKVEFKDQRFLNNLKSFDPTKDNFGDLFTIHPKKTKINKKLNVLPLDESKVLNIPQPVRELFQSTKLIDGFSTTFRQWRADGTHCKFLHGYSLSFRITFEGDLDEKNWVYDFGFGKRLKYENWTIKQWFDYMFDHTTVISETDPELETFYKMEEKGIIQLRVLPEVGCEMFAKFVFETLNPLVLKDTNDRVRILSVECFEHSKNSAIYKA